VYYYTEEREGSSLLAVLAPPHKEWRRSALQICEKRFLVYCITTTSLEERKGRGRLEGRIDERERYFSLIL